MKASRLKVGNIQEFKTAASADVVKKISDNELARKMGEKAADTFVNLQSEGQATLAQALREVIGKSAPFITGFKVQAAKRYDAIVEKLNVVRGGSIAAKNHASVKGSVASVYNRKSEVLAFAGACEALNTAGVKAIAAAKEQTKSAGYHSLIGFMRGVQAQAKHGTVNVVKIAAEREKATKLKLAKAGQLGARKASVQRNIMFASVKELEQLQRLIVARLVVARKREAAQKHAAKLQG